MNWDALGAVAEFVGALAVLATLIYLSLQVRQSNKYAEAEALRSVTDIYRAVSAFLEQDDLTDIVRRGLADFDALIPDEQSKFNAHVRSFYVQIEQVHFMYEMGLIGEELHQDWLNVAVSFTNEPGCRKWWNDARHLFSTTFMNAIDAAISEASDKTPSLTTFQPWLKIGA